MRLAPALAAALLALSAPPADAALREASVGNYYFEDDVAKDRKQLVVDQGDQIRFTVREGTYPPHSVQVDELGISSPDLLLFDTFTTPPLDKPGSYKLYCRPHEDRGHVTTLIVRAARTPTTSAPAATGTTPTSAEPGSTTSSTEDGGSSTSAVTGPGTVPPPAAGDAPVAATVPSGVGRATDQRRAAADPDSLAGLLGRDPGGDEPWTRALRLGVMALLLLAGAAYGAVWAGRRRNRGMGP